MTRVPATAVGRGDKARRHVAAQECDAGAPAIANFRNKVGLKTDSMSDLVSATPLTVSDGPTLKLSYDGVAVLQFAVDAVLEFDYVVSNGQNFENSKAPL